MRYGLMVSCRGLYEPIVGRHTLSRLKNRRVTTINKCYCHVTHSYPLVVRTIEHTNRINVECPPGHARP